MKLTSRKNPSMDPAGSMLRGMVYVRFLGSCPFSPPIKGIWVFPKSLQHQAPRARLKRARPRVRPKWRR